jgi:hypothetical protein
MKNYHFIISFIFSSILNSGFAQTSTPYFCGWDDSSQESGWMQFRLGDENPFYQWELSNFENYSGTQSLIHNYPVGSTEAVNDWYVSPEFDFSEGGQIDSLRYLYAGFGTPIEGDTIQLVLIEGNQNPNLATNLTVLYSFTDSTYVVDGIWKRIENINIPLSSEIAYIGFKYFTTDNWLDVRFDNFTLSSNTAIGIKKPNERDISIYPNPSRGRLYFKDMRTENYSILVLNQKGERVLKQRLDNKYLIDIQLPDGIYVVEIKPENGNPSYRKIIIRN